jgi:hypothetical protein
MQVSAGVSDKRNKGVRRAVQLAQTRAKAELRGFVCKMRYPKTYFDTFTSFGQH